MGGVSPSVGSVALSSTAFAAADCSASSLANRFWKGVTAHCLLGCNVTRALVVIDRVRRTRDVCGDCSARKAARRKRYLLQGRVSGRTLLGHMYIARRLTFWVWGDDGFNRQVLGTRWKAIRIFRRKGLLRKKTVSHRATSTILFTVRMLWHPAARRAGSE